MKPTAIVVMGVSGCGKSSVAQAIFDALQARGISGVLIEGDDFHPAENVEKMRTGTPLNDEDRQPWLLTLNAELKRETDEGKTVVLACSALKQKYRDLLSQDIQRFRLVHPCGSFELIEARMKARQHKYMPASLLRSQFETLEPPTEAISLNIAEPIGKLSEQAMRQLLESEI